MRIRPHRELSFTFLLTPFILGRYSADRKEETMSALLDRLRDEIRVRHYSIRTEHAYCDWVKRYCHFHGLRHPKDMGAAEINQFLTHLAVDGNVAASTQNQALNALVFLYRRVFNRDVGELGEVVRAKRPKKLPGDCWPTWTAYSASWLNSCTPQACASSSWCGCASRISIFGHSPFSRVWKTQGVELVNHGEKAN